MGGFKRRVLLVSLTTVLVLSLALFGCGGSGGGDGGGVIDNSEFYGDYTILMTVDSCAEVIETVTIGGDLSRKDEDSYIYFPKNENSTTHTTGDRTITIDINGKTVTYTQVDPDEMFQETFVFSDDFDNFSINGVVVSDIQTDCDGIITGNAVRVGSVGVIIDPTYPPYLQYLTSNWLNGNRGFVQLTKDGIPVAPSDIKIIELKDSSGALINLENVSFYTDTNFLGMWNSVTASVDFSGPWSYAGFSIGFPDGFELPADDYTWEVTLSDDVILSETTNYPGKKILPVVDSATMLSQWLDNSLNLSWTNPANNPPGDYDQLSVLINDQTAGNMLYIRLPFNVNEITIPSNWVKILQDYYSLTTVRWTVQTRSYTAENMNNARGYTDLVTIPDFGP